ncbi:ComEB Deoxycytidylate deaminase [uncultured Caudovirales phage]|uniref:ComEB Deoxycytidylate deaminase n=1 Tax=uncultured Caudovirales phage TaxID=2100421 RepID=A0A6J5NWE5_9CAUD|nr:ComEB Deoxycytidylate deaminase [uncultured Caudovirales phage]CAB4165529.1 ComEB Deoxycytidylate deaminase [uncultured Caudovirales phage]CAB4186819.1 ComEB Deoxycytidylate deaminase [uncultured Caudovirales phage]CAB4221577.1 ComEB Deoxycytidylate deaminase [uncultured Caudovirales phage]
MKTRFKNLYLDIASRVAQMSRARRLQVGCIVVKDDRIISLGYNGTAAGQDNNCEDNFYDEIGTERLKTKPEVIHAESNAISKLAKSTESGLGADMFITHAPCLECAKLIFQSGINRVFFGTIYRDIAGLDYLAKCGVEVNQIENTAE